MEPLPGRIDVAADEGVQAPEHAYEEDGQLSLLRGGVERALGQARNGGRADADDPREVPLRELQQLRRPPGAFIAESAIANFTLSRPYIQPVKFAAVREAR